MVGILLRCGRPFLAHQVISRRRSKSVAFGGKADTRWQQEPIQSL